MSSWLILDLPITTLPEYCLASTIFGDPYTMPKMFTIHALSGRLDRSAAKVAISSHKGSFAE